MKNILLMVRNEAIKLFKRKSTIFLVAFLIILSIAIPWVNESYFLKENIDSEIHKSQIDQQLATLGDRKEDMVTRVNLELEKEIIELLNESGITNYQWYYIIYRDYDENARNLKTIEMIENGVSKKHLEYSSLDTEIADKFYNLSKDQLAKEKQYYTSNVNKLRKQIKNKDWSSFFTAEKITVEKQINDLKEELKNPGDMPIQSIENQIYNSETYYKLCNYIIDNKLKLGDDWQDKVAAKIIYMARDNSEPFRSEKDFISQNGGPYDENSTYDQYLTRYNKRSDDNKNIIQMYWYSLENNIQPMDANVSNFMAGDFIMNARNLSYYSTSFFIIAVVFLMVIISGGIIALEYSRRTITSLLIYCPSRIKVIISKLILLLITAIVITTVGCVLIQITSGFLLGFKDFFTPAIKCSAGIITSESFFIIMFKYISVAMLPIIALGALTVCLSALTKNVAVAVGIPLVLVLSAFSAAVTLLGFNQAWIMNTFLPYLTLWNMNKLIYDYDLMYSARYNASVGVIWLISIAVVSVAITIFKVKTDDI